MSFRCMALTPEGLWWSPRRNYGDSALNWNYGNYGDSALN
jgi:hypothetical protein